MRAIELSTNSMILYDELERPVALLVEHANRSIDMYTEDDTTHYTNMDAVFEDHGAFSINKRPEKKTTIVEGFPVDFDEVFNIKTEDGISSFTKNETSKIRYAAGYFGIMFSDQYVPAYCPKTTTLAKYQTIGPFTEVITLRSELLLANKSIA